MRSLWSGVSGLQAHQVAMDVEGDNISNVNTIGFKYARANFADMLSQTTAVATGPVGKLGGTNATQIGLGTGIESTTKIMTQGTLQSTDKITDLAISGNGYFVVSPDSGSTKFYTRNGDFLFDADGNFVTNSGYIVQGWMRNPDTGAIDATGPLENIIVEEGYTMPAKTTSVINVKANLDSGPTIGTRSIPIYALDQFNNGYDINNNQVIDNLEIHSENDVSSDKFYTGTKGVQMLTERGVDLATVFNAEGDALAIRDGQGIWVSYANATTQKFTVGSDAAATIGQFSPDATLDITLNGVVIQSKAITSISDVAALINAQSNITGVNAEVSSGNKLTLINRNNVGTTGTSKNIHLSVNQAGTVDTTGLQSTDVVTAYQYVYSSSATTPVHVGGSNGDDIVRTVHTTEDLRSAMQKDARYYVDYDGNGKIETAAGVIAEDASVAFADGGLSGARNVLANYDTTAGTTYEQTYNDAITAAEAAASASGITLTDAQKHLAGVKALFALDPDTNDGVTVIVNKAGQFELANPKNDVADRALYVSVTGLTNAENNVNENTRFTTAMASLDGALSPSEAIRTSSVLTMASHGSTVEIYDSLGSKHTVNIKWAKTGTTTDGGTEWNMIIQVAEPAEINFSGTGPSNVITGAVRFDSSGAISSFYPSSFTFSGNNGSAAGQSVSLNFGLNTEFDGLTSFDKDSATEYINQDGYEGGTLTDKTIDQTGTIIGAFSNGQSLALAQVGMATFTNDEGLFSEGGNVFSATANSGEPVYGAASTGSKGTISSSKLEQSNVDLSRSLTQLIIVQRGFQANSKTITTSDEMLNTLLQLKN